MENFFYSDEFYYDMDGFLNEIEINELADAEALPDDAVYNCFECDLEPIVTLSPQWISERIGEERWSENNCDNEADKVSKALSLIDFDKVNELMPKLYYPTRRKFVITKNDILEYIK